MATKKNAAQILNQRAPGATLDSFDGEGISAIVAVAPPDMLWDGVFKNTTLFAFDTGSLLQHSVWQEVIQAIEHLPLCLPATPQPVHVQTIPTLYEAAAESLFNFEKINTGGITVSVSDDGQTATMRFNGFKVAQYNAGGSLSISALSYHPDFEHVARLITEVLKRFNPDYSVVCNEFSSRPELQYRDALVGWALNYTFGPADRKIK